MPRRLSITGPYQADVFEYEDPPLEPNQVRIKTELASGKHGTTTGGFDGRAFKDQNFDQEMRLFIPADAGQKKERPRRDPPSATGTSGVGVVTEVGSEVTRWKKGDRVFGSMRVQETNTCSEDALFELGDIDPELAICVEPAYVSIHSVREGDVRYGDNVAVVGLGAIGLIAVVMAREGGAEKVFAVDPLPIRREWAVKNGADDAFDPIKEDAALKIHQATGMKGVDVAIEASGAYPALHTAIRSARICGTVVSAGFYQGEAHSLHLGREWHHNRLNIVIPHGCGWGHLPRDYPRWDRRRAQESIVGMMRIGKLKAPGLIHPIVPIEKGKEVYRLMKDDPNQLIKYGVRFS
jgi:threonine dehydrogenase-like Zn-dependent dehydrogenase